MKDRVMMFVIPALIAAAIGVGAALVSRCAQAQDATPSTPEIVTAYKATGEVFRLFAGEPCPASSGWLQLRRGEEIRNGVSIAMCWLLVDGAADGGYVLAIDSSLRLFRIPIKALSIEQRF